MSASVYRSVLAQVAENGNRLLGNCGGRSLRQRPSITAAVHCTNLGPKTPHSDEDIATAPAICPALPRVPQIAPPPYEDVKKPILSV
jgi:hypothetical protein